MERPVTSEFFREFSLRRRQELREIGMMEGDNLIYTPEGGFRYARTMDALQGIPKQVGDTRIEAVTSVVWFEPTGTLRRELLSKFAA